LWSRQREVDAAEETLRRAEAEEDDLDRSSVIAISPSAP
jgi:hypothetical protein